MSKATFQAPGKQHQTVHSVSQSIGGYRVSEGPNGWEVRSGSVGQLISTFADRQFAEQICQLLCEMIQEQATRLAPAEVSVPPHYLRYTQPDRQFPGECFRRACSYVLTHRLKGMVYVFGTTLGGGMGEHAWVELPGNIVFDGVLQRFYDLPRYYEIEHAMPWYKFTRSAVRWIVEQRFEHWRWDWPLGLPWAKSGHDTTAEVLLVDRKDAQRLLAARRRKALALPGAASVE